MVHRFCTRCGLTLEEADFFCPRCGTARYRGASSASAGGDSAPQNPSARRNFGTAPTASRSTVPPVVLAAFVAGVVSAATVWLGAGYFFSPRYSSANLVASGSDRGETTWNQGGFQLPLSPMNGTNCPQNADVVEQLIRNGCETDKDPMEYWQGAQWCHVRILSGTGALAGISASNKTIHTGPGQPLVGTIELEAQNGYVPDAVTPLIGTPSWGPHASSWWLINGWIPTGISNYTTNVTLKAPAAAGDYAIIFAFSGEMNGAQVASATNWSRPPPVWNDCNDLAALSGAQLHQAQECGFTVDDRLFPQGYVVSYVPADAIIVHVEGTE